MKILFRPLNYRANSYQSAGGLLTKDTKPQQKNGKNYDFT
jgi:hypothetical protein